MLKTKTQV